MWAAAAAASLSLTCPDPVLLMAAESARLMGKPSASTWSDGDDTSTVAILKQATCGAPPQP